MKQTLNTLRTLYVRLAALALVVGLVVRIVLLFNEQTKLRIFSDTMLRANEQAAQRSREAAQK